MPTPKPRGRPPLSPDHRKPPAPRKPHPGGKPLPPTEEEHASALALVRRLAEAILPSAPDRVTRREMEAALDLPPYTISRCVRPTAATSRRMQPPLVDAIVFEIGRLKLERRNRRKKDLE